MRRKRKIRFANRQGLAAVEAAVCMPVLIVIWLGTVEISRTLTLKQQGQLLSSTAANRVIDSSSPFSEIESDVAALGLDVGILGLNVSVERFDSELVGSTVTVDIDQNSSLGTLFPGRSVSSTYYSYREEE